MNPTCVCGHPASAHHATRGCRLTWCSVWDPNPCRCPGYQEAPS